MIKSFTDLNAWKEAQKFTVEIYRQSQEFPKSEQFGLTSQIRRASVSIVSNIAEGFSRATVNDKVHFYTMALGSLTEVQSQIYLVTELEYISLENRDMLLEKSVIVQKLLHGLMKSAKGKE